MATISIDQMRKVVADRYPGTSWKIKVKNMPDDQILAIYMRLIGKK